MLKSRSSSISNPASMGRLIAHMMLTDIQQEQKDSTDAISVMNMLRLLEMYQFNLFNQLPPPALAHREDFKNPQLMSRSTQYSKLRDAIKAVHSELDKELSVSDFVSRYRSSLATFAEGARKQPGPQDREIVTAFLTKLNEKLAP